MGLILAQPPQGGLDAVALALDHLGVPSEEVDGDDAAGEALGPIPLYRIGEAALSATAPFGAAVRFGWRYIVRDGEGAATIDISDEERPQLLRMRRGDTAKRLLRAAARAEAASGKKEQEVRILAVNQLSGETLWLTAPDGERFIPLAGGRSYGARTMLRRIRRRVRREGSINVVRTYAPGFNPDHGDSPSGLSRCFPGDPG